MKTKHANCYPLIAKSTLALDKQRHLAQQVRDAFVGVADDLFDYIRISDLYGYYVRISNVYGFEPRAMIEIHKNPIHCFRDGFKFFSTSSFEYIPELKEPWHLSINKTDEVDGGFGCQMSITAKTPRQCVLAMIQERKNHLNEALKALRKFKNFQNYTRISHSEC